MKKKDAIERSQPTETTHQNFHFEVLGDSKWMKELDGQPEIFENIDWPNIAELEEIVEMQQKVWGMPERDAVPSNLLAIIGETGGNVLTAKNGNGVLEGFVFTLGARDGSLFLHMIGVAPDQRYKKNIGWNLSVLQLLEARKQGVERIVWTYDPMRGSNARLNLEKLGTTVEKYTINKYGRVDNKLYGEDPTDRFTATWDISDPYVLARITSIENGTYQPRNIQQVAHLPILEGALVDPVQAPDVFLVEVPYDIDTLSDQEKTLWRMRLRNILTSVLDTEEAQKIKIPHGFLIDGFATGQVSSGIFKSFYVVSKKD